MLTPEGQVLASTAYSNVISGHLQNPRSSVWNAELDRELLPNLLVRFAYQWRDTSHELVITPVNSGSQWELTLESSGRELYREFQVTSTYRVRRGTVNASYVESHRDGRMPLDR